jgi:hypothetical protein
MGLMERHKRKVFRCEKFAANGLLFALDWQATERMNMKWKQSLSE